MENTSEKKEWRSAELETGYSSRMSWDTAVLGWLPGACFYHNFCRVQVIWHLQAGNDHR